MPLRAASRLLPFAVLPLLFACPPSSAVKPTVDAQGAAPKANTPVVQAPEPARDPAAEAAAAQAEADARLLANIPPIYFALDSAQLQPQSQEVLAEVAEALRRRPAAKVRIEGHTCELGTAEYNLALGLRRAQVTREYLTRLGVPAAALESISFGEEQPAQDGVSEEAHALNRRSEVRVELQSHAAVTP